MKTWAWLLLVACHAISAQGFDPAPYQPARLQALIADADLDEISGIAASRRSDQVYWVHNDAPRPAMLVAIDGTGRRLGRLRIEGVRAVDWEDIASYELDGKRWLLIGDIGDNAAVRKDYELIAIEEPALTGSDSTMTVKPAWRQRFRYPDGSHDVESMAVDVRSRLVLLVTKHAPPVVYSLPLGPRKQTLAIASRQGTLGFIPQPSGNELLARFPAARLGGSPTGLDIDDSGTRAALLTYRDVWLFDRHAGESWFSALARKPRRLSLPPMAQAEAVGFDRKNRSIVVSGERLPAPLLQFDPTGPSDSAN